MKFLRNIFGKKVNKKEAVEKIPDLVLPEQELMDVLSHMKMVNLESCQDNLSAEEVVSFLKGKGIKNLHPRSNFEYHNPRKCIPSDDKIIIISRRYQSDYGLETDYYTVIRIKQNTYCISDGTFTDDY